MNSSTNELDALLARFDRNAHRGGDISLEPIQTLLERLEHPQDRFPPVIHIAGTNGKGSTAAFIRSMAEAAGLRVHISTSPHLVRVNERIRLAGHLIDDAYLLDCCQRAAEASEGVTTSYFELTFAAAALAFSEISAELLVLEVGLGGLLDATNIVEAPAVSVITPIALDHRAILGNTVAQIAYKKAGIIKSRRPVVSARQASDAAGVISEEAFAKSAPLYVLSPEDLEAVSGPIGLIGSHQRENAALAAKALKVWDSGAIDQASVRAGLKDVYWPARMQKLAAGPLTEQFQPLEIWLDGGHNAHGAQAIASIISDLPGRTALIVSMLETKDASAYFEALAPTGATILACPLATSQASYQPAHLADLARAAGLPATAERSFEVALSEAQIKGFDRAVICGSLYTAGAVLQSNNEAPS